MKEKTFNFIFFVLLSMLLCFVQFYIGNFLSDSFNYNFTYDGLPIVFIIELIFYIAICIRFFKKGIALKFLVLPIIVITVFSFALTGFGWAYILFIPYVLGISLLLSVVTLLIKVFMSSRFSEKEKGSN